MCAAQPASPATTVPTAVLDPAADRIVAVPASTRVIIEARDACYSLDAALLADGATVRLAECERVHKLSAPLDGRLSPSASGTSVVFPSRGGVECASPDLKTTRRLPLPALPHPIHEAQLSPDGEHLLCVLRDESDADFASYRLWSVRLQSRRCVQHAGVGSVLPLQVGWAAHAGAFVLYDAYTEALWRIRPGAEQPDSIALANVGGRSVNEMLVHPDAGWLAFSMQDPNDGRLHLSHGRLTPEGMHWEGVSRLPDGLINHLRWRCGARELAYVRSVRRKAFVEIVNALGAVTFSFELPRGTYVSGLTVTSDGRRALLLMQRGVGILELPEAG